MCLVLFSLNDHPNYKLVIAANRDEFFARPTQSARFWKDQPDLLGGRDLDAGGTWMGITRHGKISLITNYRDPANINPGAPSRGNLVANCLTSAQSAFSYLSDLQATASFYNGFNLIAGNANELFYFSNYHAGVRQIEPGLHGLSNHLLDTPWPKVTSGMEKLQHSLLQNEISPESLFEMLYDDNTAPDENLPDTGIGMEREKALSSIFIKTGGYGTRCSTVVLVDKKDHIHFEERVFDPTSYNHTTGKFDFAIS